MVTWPPSVSLKQQACVIKAEEMEFRGIVKQEDVEIVWAVLLGVGVRPSAQVPLKAPILAPNPFWSYGTLIPYVACQL